MSVRPIVTIPDAVLRRKARPVTEFDKSLQVLIDDMIDTMRAAPGVGLAAPQIGIPLRVIVVEYPEDEEAEEAPPRLYVLVNPEIVRVSQEMESGVEGCLSIPGLVGEVERHVSIVVRGLNRHGQPVRWKLKNWTARIFSMRSIT